MSVEAGRVKVTVTPDLSALQSEVAASSEAAGAEIESTLTAAAETAASRISTSIAGAAEESAAALSGIGAGSLATVGTEAEAAASQTSAAFTGAAAEVDTAVGTMATTTETAATEMEGSLSATASAATGLVAAFIEFEVIKKSVEDFDSLEKANKGLEQALSNSDSASVKLAPHLEAVARSLARQTGQYQENIEATQRFFVSIDGINDGGTKATNIIDRATLAAVNMSAQFGTNGVRATRALAQALEDPSKAAQKLQRYLVDLTASQKDQIQTDLASNNVLGAREVVLDAVEKKYHDQAAAQATDSAKAKEALHELGTTVGKDVIPLVNDLAQGVGLLADGLSHLNPTVVEVGVGVIAASTALGLGLVAVNKVTSAYGELSKKVKAYRASTDDETAGTEASTAATEASTAAHEENATALEADGAAAATTATENTTAAETTSAAWLDSYLGVEGASQALVAEQTAAAEDAAASETAAAQATAEAWALAFGEMAEGSAFSAAAVEADAAAEATAEAGVSLASVLGPVGVIAAIAGAGLLLFGHDAKSAADDTKTLNDELTKAGNDLGSAFQGTVQSTVKNSKDLTNALSSSGVGIQTFTAALAAGGAKLDAVKKQLGGGSEVVGAADYNPLLKQIDALESKYKALQQQQEKNRQQTELNGKADGDAAQQAATFATDVGSALKSATTNSGQAAKATSDLTDAFGALNTAGLNVKDAFTSTDPAAAKFVQTLEAVPGAAQQTVDGLIGSGESLTGVQGDLVNMANAAVSASGLSGAAADAFRSSILQVGSSADTVKTEVDALTQGIQNYEHALHGVSDANDALIDQESSFKSALDTATGSGVDLAGALDHQTYSTLAANKAAADLRLAYEGVTSKAEDGITTAYDLARAHGSVGDALTAAKQEAINEGNSIIANAGQMGLTDAQAHTLAGHLLEVAGNLDNINGKHATAFVNVDTQAAEDELNGFITDADRRSITVQMYAVTGQTNARGQSVPSRWGNITAYEDGGITPAHIAPHEMLKYGEPATGGEAFIPRLGNPQRSEAILNEAAGWFGKAVVPTSSLVASAPTGSSSGGKVAVNVPSIKVAINGREFVAAVADDLHGELVAMDRANR